MKEPIALKFYISHLVINLDNHKIELNLSEEMRNLYTLSILLNK